MLGSQFIEHFHFLRPGWALLLVPVLYTIYQQRQSRDETRGWQAVIAPHLLEALRVRQYRNHWFNPVSLSLLVMLLMTTILMGPSWRQQPSPLSKDEAALVVVLDISDSMRQQDIQPSRLRRAKQKVADLLQLRSGSRAALVVFAGSAHTVLPLTDDPQILNQYMAAVKPAVMPRAGKFPEYSLPQIDTIISDPSLPTTVLLITDGVSDASEKLFADYFARRPHQLLVWGIGKEKLAPDSGIAPLAADSLRSLAAASGGRYIELSIDKRDLQSIHRRIDSHYVVSEDSAVPWLDSGYWLVFPCLAIFSLWFRKGWTLQWGLVLLLLGASLQPQQAQASENWFVGLWLTPDQQGRWLLQRGDYREAAVRFNNPMWKGMAFYYAEDFKLAAEYFSRVDSESARFNRANALAHSQNYVPAVRLYNAILDANPGHAGAHNNREIVQAVIDAINLMSESQADEPGAGDSSKELGEDDPQRADGAERKVFEQQELVQFNAEEILQDPAINAMWLRSVQRDPSHFLGVKFAMQLSQQEEKK
ncbi:MAG: VWA domain-containing protein [Gammaproteobacteria bacterium]|nr:VWA domain-containing protein [Gammaproteobacteria bacterium]